MAKKINKIRKEKKGEPFEKLTAVIEMAFNPGQNVKHNIRKRTNYGRNRQIDVSIEGRNIIVECKDKGKKVTPAEMDSFIQLCRSTNSEGIFVSKKGFTDSVLDNAKFNNIKTYTLSAITSDEFKSNFRVPEVEVLKFEYKYTAYTFATSVEPFASQDDFVYSETGEQMKSYLAAQQLFQLFMNDHMHLNYYIPLVQKILPGQQKEYLDKVQQVQEFVPVAKNKYFLSHPTQGRVPIDGAIFLIEYSISLKHREKEVFLQKDAESNVVSQTVTAEMNYNNLPYSLAVVDRGVEGEQNVSMIPKFGSSEIIQLQNLGELKAPSPVDDKK
jgi:hypothetical protein